MVAYQGEPGAFSEQAVLELWADAVVALPCESFAEVTRAVAEGRARFGALPVENAIAGPVREAQAALAASGLAEVGETALPIRLCLLALPGATLAAIRVVESHPIALQQCADWIAARPWMTAREGYDTAGAARAAAASGDVTRAAVASARAGALAGLAVLAEGIEDRAGNVTRFTIIARQGTSLPSRALARGRAPANLEQ